MARTFASSTDHIELGIGGLSTLSAPFTCVMVLRRSTSGSADCPICVASGGVFGSRVSEWKFLSSNALTWTLPGVADVPTPLTLTSAEGWAIVAVSKTTGTSVVRGHKMLYSGTTWSHSDSTGTAAAPTTGDGLVVGCMVGESDPFGGDLAVAGLWNRVLTDTEIENLPHSLQQWHAAAPSALWVFDQQATSQKLLDLTGGGANENILSGTSVSTQSVPGLSYGDGIFLSTSSAASGPSSVTLTPAELTLSGVALTATPSVTLTPATLTLSAQPVVATPNVTLTPATLSLAAQALTATPGPTAVTLTPAVLALTPVPVSAGSIASTVTLTPAILSLSATQVTATPNVTLTPAVLSLTGRPLVATVGVTLTPAPLSLSARPLTATPGPTAVTLTPAILNLTALTLGVGGVSVVTLTPATLSLTPATLSPSVPASTVTLTPAGLALTARPLSPQSRPVTVVLNPATLQLTAVALSTSVGPTSVSLIPATLALSAVAVTIGIRPDRDLVLSLALLPSRWHFTADPGRYTFRTEAT